MQSALWNMHNLQMYRQFLISNVSLKHVTKTRTSYMIKIRHGLVTGCCFTKAKWIYLYCFCTLVSIEQYSSLVLFFYCSSIPLLWKKVKKLLLQPMALAKASMSLVNPTQKFLTCCSQKFSELQSCSGQSEHKTKKKKSCICVVIDVTNICTWVRENRFPVLHYFYIIKMCFCKPFTVRLSPCSIWVKPVPTVLYLSAQGKIGFWALCHKLQIIKLSLAKW